MRTVLLYGSWVLGFLAIALIVISYEPTPKPDIQETPAAQEKIVVRDGDDYFKENCHLVMENRASPGATFNGEPIPANANVYDCNGATVVTSQDKEH